MDEIEELEGFNKNASFDQQIPGTPCVGCKVVTILGAHLWWRPNQKRTVLSWRVFFFFPTGTSYLQQVVVSFANVRLFLIFIFIHLIYIYINLCMHNSTYMLFFACLCGRYVSWWQAAGDRVIQAVRHGNESGMPRSFGSRNSEIHGSMML